MSTLTLDHSTQSDETRTAIWFQDTHLRTFQECVRAKHDPDDGLTKRGQAFGEGLPNVDVNVLPEGHVSRSRVLELASSPEVNVNTVCAAVMAWGGMHNNHRNSLFKKSGTEWLGIAQAIRLGGIDRQTAYCLLTKLRSQGKLTGAGPAYFTKLIYFLMPRRDTTLKTGYIMDQWAGCSINLLVGREVVLMNVFKTWKRQADDPTPSFEFTVADENTGDNYEEFCTAVDLLRESLDITPEQVDRELVSAGGQNPERWRRYVTKQRLGLLCSGLKVAGGVAQSS